jgi:hypothetical protein
MVLALGVAALLVFVISRVTTKKLGRLADHVARVFGPGRARRVGSEIRASASPDSPFVKWEGTVIPDSWWQGGKTVSVTFETSRDQQPMSFELYSATDRDGDGHVAAFEWTRLGRSPISSWFGRLSASIPSTHIDSEAVAYCVLVRYRDREPWWSGWFESGLTYDDP